MFVGEQGELVVDRYGRHDDVAEIERGSLTSVIAFELAGQASGGPGDLLTLESFDGIPIFTPAAFLEHLRGQSR